MIQTQSHKLFIWFIWNGDFASDFPWNWLLENTAHITFTLMSPLEEVTDRSNITKHYKTDNNHAESVSSCWSIWTGLPMTLLVKLRWNTSFLQEECRNRWEQLYKADSYGIMEIMQMMNTGRGHANCKSSSFHENYNRFYLHSFSYLLLCFFSEQFSWTKMRRLLPSERNTWLPWWLSVILLSLLPCQGFAK